METSIIRYHDVYADWIYPLTQYYTILWGWLLCMYMYVHTYGIACMHSWIVEVRKLKGICENRVKLNFVPNYNGLSAVESGNHSMWVNHRRRPTLLHKQLKIAKMVTGWQNAWPGGEKLKSQEAYERWELLPHGLVLVIAWGETKENKICKFWTEREGAGRERWGEGREGTGWIV